MWVFNNSLDILSDTLSATDLCAHCTATIIRRRVRCCALIRPSAGVFVCSPCPASPGARPPRTMANSWTNQLICGACALRNDDVTCGFVSWLTGWPHTTGYSPCLHEWDPFFLLWLWSPFHPNHSAPNHGHNYRSHLWVCGSSNCNWKWARERVQAMGNYLGQGFISVNGLSTSSSSAQRRGSSILRVRGPWSVCSVCELCCCWLLNQYYSSTRQQQVHSRIPFNSCVTHSPFAQLIRPWWRRRPFERATSCTEHMLH